MTIDFTKVLTFSDVEHVPVEDNGEPLVVVQEVSPNILCQYENEDMAEYLGDRMVLREGTLACLVQAQSALTRIQPGTQIRLVYGYRHPEVQQRYFQMISQRLAEENAGLSSQEVRLRAHQFVAIPEVAGHPTGGAVDVTLHKDGCDLDMGSQILCFDSPELVPAFSKEVSEEAQGNRALLREVMIEAGFAPFNGEWWHFSYGDREWAAFYHKPYALYSPVLYQPAKNIEMSSSARKV